MASRQLALWGAQSLLGLAVCTWCLSYVPQRICVQLIYEVNTPRGEH